MGRRIIILIVCALLILVLAPVLYYLLYVPYALGNQYVSVSFRPHFYVYGEGHVQVLYNGRLLKVSGVSVRINITNSYPVPVDVKYNGFQVVLLIYNQTVTDPSDVVNNRDSLIWGAFYYALYHATPSKISSFTADGFEYYASRREQTNFTETIRTPTHWTNVPFFDEPASPTWHWEYWFNVTSYVPTGTYHMHCIAFGIEGDPQNFTITSVP